MAKLKEPVALRRAGHHTGKPEVLHTRLFMQLLVFDCAAPLEPHTAIEQLEQRLRVAGVSAVIYVDVNAPRGIGLLTWSEDPAHFVARVRPAVLDLGAGLVQRLDHAMIGRTYATGYEPGLSFWLLERPVKTALNEAWPWAIWYPLKRKGEFNRLEGREQASILKEHGGIGRAYGEQDFAHDIRLACFGIDRADNDFGSVYSQRAAPAVTRGAGDAKDAADSGADGAHGPVLRGPRGASRRAVGVVAGLVVGAVP